jgi:hypothetical protein
VPYRTEQQGVADLGRRECSALTLSAIRLIVAVLAIEIASMMSFAPIPSDQSIPRAYAAPVLGATIVLGYNDLGMHCINQDFSEIMVLPPYNNLRAQVIDRHAEPNIVTSGVTVTFTIPSNTHSADKCNFWTFSEALLGTALPPDIGLTGHGLSGTFVRTTSNDYEVSGIPIVPIDDFGRENPFPLATITVKRAGVVVARTQTVVPVSWEMNCNLCHKTPGISTPTDILRAHDRRHGTSLEQHKPVLCASCHADPVLGQPGVAGLPNLSHAMHSSHAPRMSMAGLAVPCYACHPGLRTKCLRDVHSNRGMNCMSCHGDMTAVAQPTRSPWVDEPRCGNCHTRTGFQFEQTGSLYKDSRGHMGVHCEACHGSTHAIAPATTATDNVQAISLQGYSGPISLCTVCHTSQPSESFPHRLSD